jgi:hypothetical protein
VRTLGVVDATATAVAKIRIKQFWAIPLTGKVVAGPCMMTLLPSLLRCGIESRSRRGGRTATTHAMLPLRPNIGNRFGKPVVEFAFGKCRNR